MAYYDAPFDSSPTSPFHPTNTTRTPSFPDYPSYLPPPYSTISTPYAYLQQHHPYSPYIPTHNPYTSTPSFPPFPSQQQPPPSSNPYTTYSTSYASQQYTSQQYSHISDFQKSIEQIRDVDDYYKTLQHSLTASMKENLQEMRESLADFSKKFRVVLQKKLQEKHEEEQEEQNDEEEAQPDPQLQEDIEKELNETEPEERLDDEDEEPDSSPSTFKTEISEASTNLVMMPKALNREEEIFVVELLLPLPSFSTVLSGVEFFCGEPPPPDKGLIQRSPFAILGSSIRQGRNRSPPFNPQCFSEMQSQPSITTSVCVRPSSLTAGQHVAPCNLLILFLSHQPLRSINSTTCPCEGVNSSFVSLTSSHVPHLLQPSSPKPHTLRQLSPSPSDPHSTFLQAINTLVAAPLCTVCPFQFLSNPSIRITQDTTTTCLHFLVLHLPSILPNDSITPSEYFYGTSIFRPTLNAFIIVTINSNLERWNYLPLNYFVDQESNGIHMRERFLKVY